MYGLKLGLGGSEPRTRRAQHRHQHQSWQLTPERGLLHLLIRQAGDVVHSAILKAEDVGLDAGFTPAAIWLLGGTRLVFGALTAEKRVATARTVATRGVRQAYL
jgi:hypothetical protein